MSKYQRDVLIERVRAVLAAAGVLCEVWPIDTGRPNDHRIEISLGDSASTERLITLLETT